MATRLMLAGVIREDNDKYDGSVSHGAGDDTNVPMANPFWSLYTERLVSSYPGGIFLAATRKIDHSLQILKSAPSRYTKKLIYNYAGLPHLLRQVQQWGDSKYIQIMTTPNVAHPQCGTKCRILLSSWAVVLHHLQHGICLGHLD